MSKKVKKPAVVAYKTFIGYTAKQQLVHEKKKKKTYDFESGI